MADDRHISLVGDDSTSVPLLINGGVRIAVSIVQASGFTWGVAVVDLEWTVDPDLDRWFSFTPAHQLITTRTSFTNIGVAGLVAVRLRTTTPNGSADPNAIYDWSVMLPDASVRHP